MEAKPHRLRAQDEALYMITLPSGELRYMAPMCETLFDLTEAPLLNTHWSVFIPASWHGAVQQALAEVLVQNTPQILEIDFHCAARFCIDTLHLFPVCDANQQVIAITWQGAPHLSGDNHHYEMFHHSAIAQWIMDPRPIHHYLKNHHIETPLQLNDAIEINPVVVSELRGLFTIVDANASAAKMYKMESVDRFKVGIIANASDSEIVQAAYAILSIGEESQRQTYQTDIVFAEEDKKNLWVSCEIPSLTTMDEGMFISVLDITLLKQAEKESEEREQFLATILRAVPDILMVFDFKRREPIFQNVDITKLLGYTDQDLEDTKGHILSYIAHPEDVINGESLKAMYTRLAAGDIYETTLRLQHNNGEWHHFYFRSAALDKDEKGNIQNTVVVARDITEVLKAQQILTEQQRRYQLLADNFSDVIITTDTLFRINYVSPSVVDLLGYTPEEFVKNPNAISRLGLDGYVERLARALADSVFRVDIESEDFNEVLEAEAISASGEVIAVELKVSILRDEHHLLEGMLIIVRDITERRRVDADQRLAAKVFENSTEAIYITNQQGDIVQVNKAFGEITGYKRNDVIGKKPSQLGSGWHEINFAMDIKPVLDAEGQWAGELMSRRASGEAFLVWMSISNVLDARGVLLGLITSFRDITEAKSSEESIRKLAYYDPLTDLPNRMLFHDRLLQALQRANRNRHYIAILFMDLDGFKGVNDVLGHAVGDRLLTEAAKRLKECIRSDDTVARVGGDEFTVILNALVNKEAAESAAAQVARKIIDLLNMPFVLDENNVQIGVSIGIALYPDDAINEDDLIKLADTAMYHAKEAGKNNFQFYTQDMHQRAEQLQVAETDLRKALLGDELVLAFQPKMKAHDQSLYGFEALLRWQHPQKGLLMPSGFMRTLDDLSLSAKIGEWVINEACKQWVHWRTQGHAECSVSVNIFAYHYRDPNFVTFIAQTLKQHDVPPKLLTIEITEALIMDDLGFAFAVLSDLKAIGVRIAVDDFATGTISLSSLSRLPIDEVKIDRQFIHHIETDNQQLQVVKGIINIANTFGFDVVAEGVENEEQLQTLLSADCPKVQGYLFYRPLFNADLEACFNETSPKKT